MTYVYAVPAGSQIVGWGFADANDINVQHDCRWRCGRRLPDRGAG
ncbi:MAG: hypothetical protein ACJ71Y_14275 [Blastococcus sp.]